ncbi:MAG: hypothetical protein PHS54_03695 [Clostridia bacterium]|nr:hypothetical protein [Clostridia bacterium]
MDCIPPERMVQLATQIAIELAKGKDIEEINLARNIASLISSALQVILSQRCINERKNKSKKDPFIFK